MSEIKKQLPNEHLIYIADTAHTPYGNRSQSFIEKRVAFIADFLDKKNVKAIVVACNTATAVAINQLREKFNYPIIGLEPALKPAIEQTKNNRIGVIATQATLNSKKYQNLKTTYGQNKSITEKASSILVELVESINDDYEKTDSIIEKELQPFIDAQVDSLVLGCTHYPFLKNKIQKIMGKHVVIFDSAFPVTCELKRKISKFKNQNSENKNFQYRKIDYYSSDPESAKIVFEKLLKEKICVSKI